MFKMVLNKKAISPVVATALLLVVAVVAVVGFQTWFNTYQSGLNTQIEQQSQSGSAITVERLEADGTLYLRNSGSSDVTVESVDVSAASGYSGSCSISSNFTVSANSVTNQSCGSLTQDSVYNVVVQTPDGVYSEEEIAR